MKTKILANFQILISALLINNSMNLKQEKTSFQLKINYDDFRKKTKTRPFSKNKQIKIKELFKGILC